MQKFTGKERSLAVGQCGVDHGLASRCGPRTSAKTCGPRRPSTSGCVWSTRTSPSSPRCRLAGSSSRVVAGPVVLAKARGLHHIQARHGEHRATGRSDRRRPHRPRGRRARQSCPGRRPGHRHLPGWGGPGQPGCDTSQPVHPGTTGHGGHPEPAHRCLRTPTGVVRWKPAGRPYLDYDEARIYPTLQAFIEQTGDPGDLADIGTTTPTTTEGASPTHRQPRTRASFTHRLDLAQPGDPQAALPTSRLIRMPNATNLPSRSGLLLDPGTPIRSPGRAALRASATTRRWGASSRASDDLWADDLEGQGSSFSAKFHDTVGCSSSP